MVVSMALASVITIASPVEAEYSATPVVRGASLFHFFTDIPDITRAEAIEIAENNDLVIGYGRTFREHVSAMRSVNPDIEFLHYRKGVMALRSEGNRYPDDWYLYNAAGNKVRSDPWGSYLMDPRNVEWAAEVARGCIDAVRSSGFDGCYMDVSGIGALYISDSVPLERPGGPEFTVENFHDAMVTFNRRVANRVPAGIEVMGNTIGTGRRYFDERFPGAEMAEAAGQGHAEVWMRLSQDPIDKFRGIKDFRWDLDLLVDAAERGVPVLVSTKIWVPATPAQIDRWRHYSYATFLLGTDGSHTWSFTFEKEQTDDFDNPLYAMNIGQPRGAYSEAGGIFYRLYSDGIVLVNPQAVERGLDLPGRFHDVDGNALETVTMEPNTGLVLEWRGAGQAPDYGGQPPTAPGVPLVCNGVLATIVGTDGDDVIQGTAGRDVISAGKGNDIVKGVRGDDRICGGEGDDRLEGGDGDDVIFGEDGDDDIRGHAGNDRLFGRAGNDQIYGHRGDDEIYGEFDDDRVDGGQGYDRCNGGIGRDVHLGTCEVRISFP